MGPPIVANRGSVPAMSEVHTSRERILWAAAREFADRGLAGARVDRIAEVAECNKQLIYRHFGDKDGLYHAVLIGVLERKIVPVELRDIPFGDVVEFHFRWFAQEKLLRRLLLWEALGFDGTVVAEEQRAEHIRKDIKEFRETHQLEDVPVEETPMMMIAAFAMAIFPSAFPQMVKLLTGHLPSDPAFRDRYTAFLSGFDIESFRKPFAAAGACAENGQCEKAEAFFRMLAGKIPPPIPSGVDLDVPPSTRPPAAKRKAKRAATEKPAKAAQAAHAVNGAPVKRRGA